MNQPILPEMSLKQLSALSPELNLLVPHLVVFGDFPVNEDIRLDANGPKQGVVLAEALTYLCQKIKEGIKVVSNVFSEQELLQVKALRKTSLMFIPGKKGGKTVFITSGGAFMGVYNLFEGVSCGYKLSQQGYNVFVITYRVCRYPVVDNAMDDIAASIKYVQEHKDDYDVDLSDYAFMGMSAGGHLAGVWATENKGARRYGLNNPSAILLAYPALSTIEFLEDMEKGLYTPGHCKVLRLYLNLIAGRNSNREELSAYSVELNLDKDYPPTYIIQCKDDDKVNYSTALRMKEALDDKNITNLLRLEETGGHGFGLASDTGFNDWLDQAVVFWNRQFL